MLLHQNERQSLFAEVDSAFRRDVLKGLGIKPRAIPARWLYDRRGSELFEAITALPEYYPTRTERSILSYAVSEIAALIGDKSGPAIIARTYGDVRPDHLLKQAKRVRLLVRGNQVASAPKVGLGI